MKEFVLASASPRRKELLSQIGFSFRVCVSEKEEEILRDNPTEVVKELSYLKAKDVFEQNNQHAIVIGADTIVVYDEKILGKPKDKEDAYSMIKMLQGNTHKVYTGVSILWNDGEKDCEKIFFAQTEVELYPMSEDEIQAYIAMPEPYDKAGGYAVQGYFARHVKQLRGDYNNVVGLPVGELYQILNSLNLLS